MKKIDIIRRSYRVAAEFLRADCVQCMEIADEVADDLSVEDETAIKAHIRDVIVPMLESRSKGRTRRARGGSR